MRRFYAFFASAVVIGCSSGGGSGGATSCADGGTCPAGFVCGSDGFCAQQNTGGTGGVGATSGSGGVGATSGAGGVGATGGSAGSFGGSAGVSGSGGSSGGSSCTSGACICDDGSATFTPALDCSPLTPGDPCQECVTSFCCTEWKSCLAGDNPCAFGGPSSEGEIICIQDCLITLGVAGPSEQAQCAAQCTSPGCGSIAIATNDMVACINDNCLGACLQP